MRDSLNTKWNVNVLEPREGIGGHCLPKDIKMFLNSSKSMKSKIIEAAIKTDEDYRMHRRAKEISQEKLHHLQFRQFVTMSFTDLNRTRRAVNITLLSLFIATAGALLQIGGTSWDITSHLMLKPETFFTPSHTMLYTGVGLLTISAGIGDYAI